MIRGLCPGLFFHLSRLSRADLLIYSPYTEIVALQYKKCNLS
jgi:hypothetical protein